MRRIAGVLSLMVACLWLAATSCKTSKSDSFQIIPDLELSSRIYYVLDLDAVLTHSPEREDSLVYERSGHLTKEKPVRENHEEYVTQAKSLWELKRINEAKAMFLGVLHSDEEFYQEKKVHLSDSNSSSLGYGIFITNYKHDACIYLAKISMEEGDFVKALQYVEQADNRFHETYTCGTGNIAYRNRIESLYAYCYDTLKQDDVIIERYLPEFEQYHQVLARALRRKYSDAEIQEHLKVAENSMYCVVDSAATYFYEFDLGEADQLKKELKYVGGTAWLTLFGRLVQMPSPNFEAGDIASREMFLKEFKRGPFYNSFN